MKRFLLLVSFLMIGLLIACDYDEKSFQVLGNGRPEIPFEATMDFTLPKGVYGHFTWTSSSEDVITISEGNHAIVKQQDEDVEVVLTATIGQTSRDFSVRVLNKESQPTLYEQARMALDVMTFPESVITPEALKISTGDLTFQYERLNGMHSAYRIIEKQDQSIWLVPDQVEIARQETIRVNVYGPSSSDDVKRLDSRIFSFVVDVDRDGRLKHREIFEALDIVFQGNDHKDNVSNDFTLPHSSSLNEEAVIEWRVSPNPVIEYQPEGSVHILHPVDGIWEVKLIATVTVDEIPYDFPYIVTIYPKNYGN